VVVAFLLGRRGASPAIGFLVGRGFCCFKINKGAADITVDDVGKQMPESRHDDFLSFFSAADKQYQVAGGDLFDKAIDD